MVLTKGDLRCGCLDGVLDGWEWYSVNGLVGRSSRLVALMEKGGLANWFCAYGGRLLVLWHMVLGWDIYW